MQGSKPAKNYLGKPRNVVCQLNGNQDRSPQQN